MNCTATLTTATETDEEVESEWIDGFLLSDIPHGAAVVRRGDRLMRLDLHTLACGGIAGHNNAEHWNERAGVTWEGAAPHTPSADVCDDCAGTGAQHYNGNGDCPSCGGTGDRPTVTDEQVEAALDAAQEQQARVDGAGFFKPDRIDTTVMRAALEAAARVHVGGTS